jgi:hypothetical protein
MCYSKKLSLTSLLFGIFSSILLIIFGNKISRNTNYAIGIYFIYVSLMQFIEYLMWSDIKCENNLNKIASLLGPLLNHFQPIIILLLQYLFIKSNKIIPVNLLIIINIIYILYIIYKYYIYISNKNNLCTKVNSDNHLDWNWKYDFNYNYYFIIYFINIINFYNNKNIIITIIFGYLLLFISINNFNKNVGEFWCLMVTCVPLINLFAQKVFNINN